MEDYKRMLFAVILAALFIYLWTSFFAKPPVRRATGVGADSTLVADSTGVTGPAGTPGTAGASREGQRPAPVGRPRTEPGASESGTRAGAPLAGAWIAAAEWDSAVVETELCRGRLAAVGGGLASWKLREFLDRRDEPVNLVVLAQGAAPELHLELISGDTKVSLDEVPFQRAEIPATDPAVAEVLELSASDSAGASVVKTFTFYNDRYYFDLHIAVTGFPAGEGMSCAISWGNGLPVTEPNEKADVSNFAALSLIGEEFVKDKMGGFGKEPVKTHEGNVLWTGVRNKYFMAALIPTHTQGRAVRTWGDPDRRLVATQLFTPMRVSADGAASAAFRVYAGPMDFERLRAVGDDLGEKLALEKDVYPRFRFMAPLNHLVFGLMKWTYGLVPNYGVVIILVSAVFKLIFYPLTKSSLKSMQAMKKVQPELEALKKKYKGDAKKMNQAQMELFRKHKVNPMGGCLPILVQMPIFFALYNVLVGSVELRRAPFVAWIDDLSAPDTLFHAGTFPVHVLPLIMAVTQLAQPTMGPSTDSRQQMMKYMMPVFLLVIFYGLPSGLVLYWTVNNVMTALQQYLMNRSQSGGEEVPAPPSKPVGRKRRANKS